MKLGFDLQIGSSTVLLFGEHIEALDWERTDEMN
jgi:hypothetical protein